MLIQEQGLDSSDQFCVLTEKNIGSKITGRTPNTGQQVIAMAQEKLKQAT